LTCCVSNVRAKITMAIIQFLHASDLEGGVDAIDRAPNFAAIADALEQGGASQGVDAIFTISGGDNYLPGPFFNAAGDRSVRDVLNESYETLTGLSGLDIREAGGRFDIQIMNIIGFDASTFGNHEFDLTTDTTADIIATDIRDDDDDGELDQVRWLGAQFPYLSANLDFTNDGSVSGLFTDQIQDSRAFQSIPADLSPAALTAAADAPKIAPATILDQDGDPLTTDDRVGVIGATTPLLQSISSPGDTTVREPGAGTNDMAALAQILQPQIDALEALGIDKIVLTSHLQQIALEQELAPLLSGIDVIIASGSDTILADSTDTLRPGDTATGNYPILSTNADGEPVAIVSTDGEYSYVGNLVVEFDANGVLLPNSINPLISGSFATTDDVVNTLWSVLPGDPFADGTKGAEVRKLTDAVRGVVTEQDGNVFGRTNVFLEGRRNAVRTESTNLGVLTAEANLFVAQQFDSNVVVSIKNGGGIRSLIGEVDQDGNLLPTQANPISGKQEGEISQLDITNSLRFNNELSILTLTAEQLVQVLEHGISASVEGATPGQFPQVAGLRFSFDDNLTIQSLVIVDDEGTITDVLVRDGEFVGKPNKKFKIVTLNFLADGGDNYPFDEFSNTNRVDLVEAFGNSSTGVATFAEDGTEQDALAEYLAAFFSDEPFDVEETSPENDIVIQNLRVRNDVVLDIDINVFNLRGTGGDDTIQGGNLDDVIRGRRGNDIIIGLSGNDRLFGGKGDDTIDCGDGDDEVKGRAGDDDIDCGDGDDLARGNQGDDSISGGAGDDRILGFRDNDILFGDEGEDFIRGGSGDDEISGGDDDDFIHGGLGDDVLEGNDGDDDILGGRGDDLLFGGDGDDFLWAQDGNDRLEGGDGDDLLFGGRDNDIFVLANDGSIDTYQGFRISGDDEIELIGFDVADLSVVEVSAGAEIVASGSTVAIVLDVSVSTVELALGIEPAA
jgi:2',3'-cyclic-nucleotide 2'-phosphodiesterase (5'-nucleotidase family)